MDVITFLVVYISLLLIMVGMEIYILSNDKYRHLKISYRAVKTIFDSLFAEGVTPNITDVAEELNRFYNEYIQEMPQLKKLYSNVVVWVDAIIFRIDFGNKQAAVLMPYVQLLKQSRDLLAKENPFNKCEKYQQSILHDMEKLKTADNDILVQNIIDRTQEEFLRLSGDIKKNNLLNIVSIAIGVIGILISILMTFIKF